MLNEIVDGKSLIEIFISSYVDGRSLDARTEKAYRMDLEHFYVWMASTTGTDSFIKMDSNTKGLDQKDEDSSSMKCWEDWIEAYLDYLRGEKGLSASTIYRKNRVLGYFLSYLVGEGVIEGCRPLKPVSWPSKRDKEAVSEGLLLRKDADALFRAMNREYEGLDSEFRRRVCLRDMTMMELLFYHKIEISQLLRIEVQDYDQGTGTLQIRRKRGDCSSIHLYSQELLRKMKLWLEERKAFCHEGEYDDRMFLSKYGRPLSMEMFIQIVEKYRKLAGIDKKLTPKDLKESSMKQYAKELMMERCS